MDEVGGLIIGENGKIEAVGKKVNANNIPSREKYIDVNEKHIFPGIVDMRVFVGEPGYEYKENFRTLSNAALSGGVTSVVTMPNTNPIIDNSTTISFIKNTAFQNAVTIHPIGALTKDSKGEYLAELYDMQQTGAVAFGDYQHGIENPNMLKIALQYTNSFNGLVLSYPQENRIAGKGIVNEEETSTTIGLKGIPNLAEELQGGIIG